MPTGTSACLWLRSGQLFIPELESSGFSSSFYKILEKISEKESLIILRRLAERDPAIARQIEKEAEQLLLTVDLDEICEEVFFALDLIDV